MHSRRRPQIRLADAGHERRAGKCPRRSTWFAGRERSPTSSSPGARDRDEDGQVGRSQELDRQDVLLARNDPAWTYWYGRANASSAAAGSRRFSSASQGNTVSTGAFAAEELGVNLQIPARAPLPTESEIAEVAAIPDSARRARALSPGHAHRRDKGVALDRPRHGRPEAARGTELRGATKPGTGPSAPRTGRSSRITFSALPCALSRSARRKARSRDLDEPWCWGGAPGKPFH